MTHMKSQALKVRGRAFKEHEPFRHYSPGSLLTDRTIKPRVTPGTVGVATGNQETSRKVGSDPMASLGEENNSLEKFKALQKKHLQLKGILKEKESSISRLTKLIKDQATEYRTAIEFEKEHQKETERQLEESEHLVKEQSQLLDETVAHYTKIIQEQETQHAELVHEMKKQSEADIRRREENILKIKQYISGTFQEKSREHQQQTHELRREINKFMEKSHILKTKLEKELNAKKRDCKSKEISP
ncbi:inner centromere protein isoform X1 [Zootoca vivipara]|uniref:inner centromere protein isoform X1 n=1 Tax=Zootoca vivipara TaxID=8524 RepID=UPI00293C08F1|nr:inner centromere protein isoform X1 [Zootoca vivipara]XP_060129130.1 inner centromere protein isoform X1 [Zootoca vivipara]